MYQDCQVHKGNSLTEWPETMPVETFSLTTPVETFTLEIKLENNTHAASGPRGRMAEASVTDYEEVSVVVASAVHGPSSTTNSMPGSNEERTGKAVNFLRGVKRKTVSFQRRVKKHLFVQSQSCMLKGCPS